MTLIALPRRMDVQQAREDLSRRTLSEIARPLDRLIYLASMRDYNTGVYHHDGLASRFTEEVACEALADCHREVFRQLVVSSLEDLVDQLEAYRKSTHTSPARIPDRVEKARALPRRRSGGNRSACGGIPLFELQDRFGNLGGSSGLASGGTKRIATPVTCPTISASDGYANCRIAQPESGCGISVSCDPLTSHHEQA